MNIAQLLQQGGIFMVPLLILSVIALAVVMERTIYFAGLEWGGTAFRARLQQMLAQGQHKEALQWLSSLRGAVAATAAAGLSRWDKGRQAVDDAMVSASNREFSQLNKYLMVLETTVTASPLIGLLGTITGMMGVFQAVSKKISENPQADTSSILAGIGEALVATATGIFVAVVCLFFHNLFQGMAESQMQAAQSIANDLTAAVEDKNG